MRGKIRKQRIEEARGRRKCEMLTMLEGEGLGELKA